MRKSVRASSAEDSLVTRRLLRSWRIPAAKSDDSKDDRGQVFVVGGEREIPGAALLAAMAAMRVGAGKLQIATSESAAVQLGVAMPEARVIGLGETASGAIASNNAAKLSSLIHGSQAALIGPGMMDIEETGRLLTELLPLLNNTTVILDAGALSSLNDNTALIATSDVNAIITPHSGEMATLLGLEREEIEKNARKIAEETARTLGVVVVLKGPETHIASPDGEYFGYRSGDVGLATSGSGDILAGAITGIAARGATPLQAAVWGVFLHGEAGNVVAKKCGRVGYLARELLPEIPPLLNRLSGSGG